MRPPRLSQPGMPAGGLSRAPFVGEETAGRCPGLTRLGDRFLARAADNALRLPDVEGSLAKPVSSKSPHRSLRGFRYKRSSRWMPRLAVRLGAIAPTMRGNVLPDSTRTMVAAATPGYPPTCHQMLPLGFHSLPATEMEADWELDVSQQLTDILVENLERAKGFEPSTPTLAR